MFNNADEGIRRSILAIAKEEGVGQRIATEEYLSRLAEDPNLLIGEGTGSFLDKVRRFFLDMLAKVWFKLDFRLSDNELRYILWRSYKNLAGIEAL